MSVSFFPCFKCACFCRHPLSQLLLVSLMLLTFCCWHPCFCVVNARVRRIPMISMIHFKSNRSKYGSYLLDICFNSLIRMSAQKRIRFRSEYSICNEYICIQRIIFSFFCHLCSFKEPTEFRT
jgi:hypothetical protein